MGSDGFKRFSARRNCTLVLWNVVFCHGAHQRPKYPFFHPAFLFRLIPSLPSSLAWTPLRLMPRDMSSYPSLAVHMWETS